MGRPGRRTGAPSAARAAGRSDRPYTPVPATATSGDAGSAIDGKNDTDFISMWQPTGALPQAITLDLGRLQPDVGWLGCVPRYHHEASSRDGNVTDYRILTSTDGQTFSGATRGPWRADWQDEGRHLCPGAGTLRVRFESAPPTVAPRSPKSPSVPAPRRGTRNL